MTKDTPNIQELKRVLGALTYAEMVYVAGYLNATLSAHTYVELAAVAHALSAFASEPNERPVKEGGE